jgi:hypothetical protein
MHRPLVTFHLLALSLMGAGHRLVGNARRGRDSGQSTAEYALVLLGAAGVALLFITWATKSGRIGRLFDTVFDAVIGRVV